MEEGHVLGLLVLKLQWVCCSALQWVCCSALQRCNTPTATSYLFSRRFKRSWTHIFTHIHIYIDIFIYIDIYIWMGDMCSS